MTKNKKKSKCWHFGRLFHLFKKNYNELSKVVESGHLDSEQNSPHWHTGPIYVGGLSKHNKNWWDLKNTKGLYYKTFYGCLFEINCSVFECRSVLRKAPTLPAKIRQRWKWMAVANTLAFYDTATITTLKSFIIQAPGDVITTLPFLRKFRMGPIR